MFGFLVSLSFSQVYEGRQNSAIKLTADQEYNFLECQFIELGSESTESSLYLTGGSSNPSVFILATTFYKCLSKQGGSMSLYGTMNLHILLCCISECQVPSSNIGAIAHVELKQSNPTIEYVTASQCSKGQYSFNLLTSPILKNANLSKNAPDHSTAYGVIYMDNNDKEFSYGYKMCNFIENTSPYSINYFYHTHTFTIEHSNYIKNNVASYSIVYAKYNWEFTITNCIFADNIHDNSYLVERHWTLSSYKVTVKNCQIRDTSSKLFSYVETQSISSSVDDIDLYTYYATILCHAEVPYPRRSQTFMETPMNTFAETPFVTAIQTPANTAAVTPNETPFGTPYVTNYETPFSTMESTPLLTDFETPYHTPEFTPLVTPYSTMEKTAAFTPFETAYLTPWNTPFITDFETPVITPFETEFETPYLTEFETPYLTEFETPYLTEFETPYLTGFQSQL
ncbi:hypothetical protein TVAG_128650 [Trichomonas vaginalis G3]|uniref:Polymorphic repeat outer membrane protein n=1 Tax=Trichomonas vaginalis (strain ATCC PRA-98 / G3) TaxID=412133 RepID=A2E4B6_TRIV3|nr:bifunctional inhibitor/lipid-transfer protein/seed storage 2s albumin superfamily protein family [Trichomonas vaginalis G3]EAY12451.1 hypothetical protein TVAG_128650 [Trichomonas vaginalis G3]KAI5539511.1 bifunctional inhibitor/lipid-transfer protein/seed storage 2s albumin superfamily protein family [Trichomonas vaginalis G3]|eukprot:XP_001324674.1 hypothetical protein [Trichomonas vaginalis G3]